MLNVLISPIIDVNMVDDKSRISSDTLVLNVLISPIIDVNMVDDKSLISLTVSLLKSLISRFNSLEVYPDKSVTLVLIIVVVSFDKSTIFVELLDTEDLISFKLESMDASILIDCGFELGSDVNAI